MQVDPHDPLASAPVGHVHDRDRRGARPQSEREALEYLLSPEAGDLYEEIETEHGIEQRPMSREDVQRMIDEQPEFPPLSEPGPISQDDVDRVQRTGTDLALQARGVIQATVEEEISSHAVVDAVRAAGSMLSALASTPVFCPPLLVVDDRIYQCLDGAPEEAADAVYRVRQWQLSYEGDLAGAQAMVNHVHMYDLFPDQAADIDEDAVTLLAEMIARSWRVWLSFHFPGRQFAVAVFLEDEGDPQLTFWEETAGRIQG